MYYFITLTPTTWLVIGACVIILCIVLWATLKLLAKLEKRQRNISLASCFIATISGYLNQGYIIATAISANLVAKITTSYEYFPIKEIHELENQQKYGLCIRTGSYGFNNFSRYEDGKKLLLDKWINIVNVPECGNVNKEEVLVTKPCRDNLFHLENVAIMEYLLDNKIISCELTELPQKLFKTDNSIILNKFAERRLNDTLNVVYLQMLESGIRNRIKSQWLQRKIQEDNKKVLSPVTMQHMRGIFILNVFFMFEILVFNANNNSKSTKPKKLQKIIISKP
ncbi:uncharacterized protein LOC108734279 [Agrilus planipennis]|uniref:Uncharacterized protein LOC108734279 n=1 Tax=Agrilus planipennis TaxID=224129 RepID=A0A1W4WLC9_AGRPL|nr:uncharacterized protein LOC108734279 [Agrilus planipennis]